MDIVLKKAGFAIGIDMSNFVEIAYENLQENNNLLIVQGDILNPPFKKGVFDAAYPIGVLHHTPNPIKGFKNMAQLTGNSITANGTYDFDTQFKIGSIFLAGTWGGGTATFYQSYDGANYVAVANGSFTSNTIINFISGAPKGRIVLTGSTNPVLQVYVTAIY